MTSTLPVVVPDREPLTELEARRIGDSSYRLGKYREMLKAAASRGSEFEIPTVGVVFLTSLETQAILSLLIERETLFLASFNVAVEATQ